MPRTDATVHTTAKPSRARVLTAFAAVYVIWGSTYLAIRFGIESIPPLLMAGTRFLVAGGALYAWARLRGDERPTRAHWASAFIIGGLLLTGGNGAVTWAEQRVPSGVASLLVATLPLWIVLLEWLRRSRHQGSGRARPPAAVLGGVALGLVGLVVLVGPGLTQGASGGVDPVGAAVLIAGSLSWAVGSLYARRATLPRSGALAMGMEMLAGGTLLLVAAVLRGEPGNFDASAVTTSSVMGLLYLITFGSLIGFTAYVWLLGVAQPAHVATYAYVNPVVAVFLGWAIAGEPITGRTLVAAAIIVGAVALITTGNRPSPDESPDARATPERAPEAERRSAEAA
ncbi:MAG TPA: drug/metabolite exporter YedA [Gemmatimonadaceae bacterium]|nr:drug/metabolite exporter YedA [Gemmatimonadaceae bacterium]